MKYLVRMKITYVIPGRKEDEDDIYISSEGCPPRAESILYMETFNIADIRNRYNDVFKWIVTRVDYHVTPVQSHQEGITATSTAEVYIRPYKPKKRS